MLLLVGGAIYLYLPSDLGNDNLEEIGLLVDVTNGDVTGGLATGIAQASYKEGGKYSTGGKYSLIVGIDNLVPPEEFCEGCRYEGWIIRRGVDMDIRSSGEAVLVDGNTYENLFESSVNLTDRDFYVLTVEKNFGDGIPEDHVLEGEIKIN